jgi:hypothetical protein
MEELVSLIRQGVVEIRYSKKNRPFLFTNGQLECNSFLKKYGFNSIYEFEAWYKERFL